MSYQIKVGIEEYTEKNKDDVIAMLIAIITNSNEVNAKVTFPDGSSLVDEAWGEEGWEAWRMIEFDAYSTHQLRTIRIIIERILEQREEEEQWSIIMKVK